MSEGWITLYRSMLEHPLWQDKPFAKGQAWIDLLLQANHCGKDVLLGNQMLKVGRGTFITSELKLMERWGWSKGKVRAFLKLLQEEHMIEKTSDRKKTTINVVNYSKFQDAVATERPQKNHKKTADDTQTTMKQLNNNIPNGIYTEGKTGADSPYTTIQSMYNSVCGSYPRLVKLSEKRKTAIRARMKAGYTLDDFQRLFEKAEASSFLRGENTRNWSADFDWMISDKYMPRVLEGRYDNQQTVGISPPKGYNALEHPKIGEMQGLREFLEHE